MKKLQIVAGFGLPQAEKQLYLLTEANLPTDFTGVGKCIRHCVVPDPP